MVTTVFVYEDNPDWQSTLRGMLEDDGFTSVHVSDDLNEAKRSVYLMAGAIRLIFSDFDVQSEGDGQLFVDECRKLAPDAYIVGIGREDIRGADANPGKLGLQKWYKEFMPKNKERFLG